MDEGELVTYTHGRVTKIDKWMDGAKSDGSGEKWSFQKLTISDGKNNVMVKVWDRDALPKEWIGKELYCFSTMGGNNRLGGLKIKSDNYQGRTTKYVNCTPSAGLELAAPAEAEGDQAASAPATAKPAQPQQRQAQPAQSESAPSPETQHAVKWQPLGPTVGMAVNNACASITAQGKQLTTVEVFNLASDILRAVKWLEDGKIAPKKEDREKKAE